MNSGSDLCAHLLLQTCSSPSFVRWLWQNYRIFAPCIFLLIRGTNFLRLKNCFPNEIFSSLLPLTSVASRSLFFVYKLLIWFDLVLNQEIDSMGLALEIVLHEIIMVTYAETNTANAEGENDLAVTPFFRGLETWDWYSNKWSAFASEAGAKSRHIRRNWH